MNELKEPVFVVVGAQNRGKSTFVKAMTNDKSINVHKNTRTTTESKKYEFAVGGGENKKTYLSIWDTPGFEMPAQAYETISQWVNGSQTNPSEALERFVSEFKDYPQYKYEVEILKPLTNHACLVFIADCSIKYSPDYNTNMLDLLMLTNLPRIAILNPIDGQDYLDEWRIELRKYFHNIKVFNPHKTSFNEKIEILEAFSHLEDRWTLQIQEFVAKLKKDRENALTNASKIIRNTILRIYNKKFEMPFDDNMDEDEHKKELQENVREYLKKVMDETQSALAKNFDLDLNIKMNHKLDDNDLFDEAVRREYISNYNRSIISAVVGALAGAGVDLLAAGLAFGIFTAAGGVTGAVVGYTKKLDMYDLLNFSSTKGESKKRYEIKNLKPEIGLLVINRLRQVVSVYYNRTAVNNEEIVIDKDLNKKDLIAITQLISKISKHKKHRQSEAKKKELLDFIISMLKEDQKKYSTA